jgi:hypothetical protein
VVAETMTELFSREPLSPLGGKLAAEGMPELVGVLWVPKT